MRQIPGPGEYNTNKVNFSSILYLVSTIRAGNAWSFKGGKEKVSTFDEQLISSPGPGAYRIEGEIGDSNVYDNLYIRPQTTNNYSFSTPLKNLSSNVKESKVTSITKN